MIRGSMTFEKILSQVSENQGSRPTWLNKHLLSTYQARWLAKKLKEGAGRCARCNWFRASQDSVRCVSSVIILREWENLEDLFYLGVYYRTRTGVGFEKWLRGLWWDITGTWVEISGRQKSAWGKTQKQVNTSYVQRTGHRWQKCVLDIWEKSLIFWSASVSLSAKHEH